MKSSRKEVFRRRRLIVNFVMVVSLVAGLTLVGAGEDVSQRFGLDWGKSDIRFYGHTLLIASFVCVMAHAFSYGGNAFGARIRSHPTIKQEDIKGFMGGGLYDPNDFR